MQRSSARPLAIFFAEYFPPYMGSDRRIVDLARNIRDWNVEFAVVPPLRILGGRCERPLRTYFETHFSGTVSDDERGGLHGHYFRLPNWLLQVWRTLGIHAGYALTVPYLIRQAITYLRARKPDVVVAAHPSYLCGLAGVVAARACGIPVVLDYPDAWTPLAIETAEISSRSVSASVLRAIEGFTARRATRIVSITGALRSYVRSLGARAPIDVVPNGADDAHFAASTPACPRASIGCADGDEIVLYSGRLELWSGVEDLANNIAAICGARERARVVIAGDGMARARLEDEVRARGLRERVRFLGFQCFSKMPALLAAADVAIVPFPQTPTTAPCSPVKLFEYMLMRKAVVTTDLPGVRESVDERHVAFIDGVADAKMARAVVRILEDTAYRASLEEQAYRHCKDSHTIERLAGRFSQSMHAACGRYSRSGAQRELVVK